MTNDGLTVRKMFHIASRNRGRREIRCGPKPVPETTSEGRIPRITRLMALAIRFEHLLQSGAVASQAELAALGHVSRARMTQIMNLLHLAPEIKEAILSLPRTVRGHDLIREIQIRPMIATLAWQAQRQTWQELVSAAGRTNRRSRGLTPKDSHIMSA